MQSQKAISICIPAYQRIAYLQRLLDSICVQSFIDFEVVITDDSPDDTVEQLCKSYSNKFNLFYCRNSPKLGTPENWNEAIRHAKGEWIKLMHDDDWFASPDSLQKLYNLTKTSSNIGFVFCGSTIIENNSIVRTENISRFREKLLRKDPQNLFFRNFIGPPSVIMHRNDQMIWYDKRMKWLVDVDFYIRYLLHDPVFSFTREYLINVGFNEGQVTRQVFSNKEIVIPENLQLLGKLDDKILRRLWNYDFAWRLMRNYGIRSAEELYRFHPGEHGPISPALLHIVKVQKRIPHFLLQQGWMSKCFMLVNYFTYRFF